MQTGQQHAGLDEKAYLGGNAFPTMPCVLSAGHYIPSSNLYACSTVEPSHLLCHQHRFIAQTAPHIPNPPLFTVDHDAERLKHG